VRIFFEYSFEASALFNPRIVRHPDQSSTPENGCRFILRTLDGSAIGQDSNLVLRPDEGVIIAPANSYT
jgi:hypothetical protein